MGDSWAVMLLDPLQQTPPGLLLPQSPGFLHLSYLNHGLLPVKGTALMLLGFYLVFVIALPRLDLLDGWIFKRVAQMY